MHIEEGCAPLGHPPTCLVLVSVIPTCSKCHKNLRPMSLLVTPLILHTPWPPTQSPLLPTHLSSLGVCDPHLLQVQPHTYYPRHSYDLLLLPPYIHGLPCSCMNTTHLSGLGVRDIHLLPSAS